MDEEDKKYYGFWLRVLIYFVLFSSLGGFILSYFHHYDSSPDSKADTIIKDLKQVNESLKKEYSVLSNSSDPEKYNLQKDQFVKNMLTAGEVIACQKWKDGSLKIKEVFVKYENCTYKIMIVKRGKKPFEKEYNDISIIDENSNEILIEPYSFSYIHRISKKTYFWILNEFFEEKCK